MKKPIIFVVAGALLAFSACDKGEKNKVDILPVHADLAIDTITTDPAVYLARSSMGTGAADVVAIDVMLRDGAAPTFDAFTLEVMFDPGLQQVGRVIWNATPLGDCTGTGACDPICGNNVSPSGTSTIPANDSGDLLIGVATKPTPCTGTSNPGPVPLLTLWFISTTVGTSQVKLIDGAGHGDCEILSGAASLGFPCLSGNATITAAR
jgi:hypothetical protein